MKDFGQIIAALRKILGLTQEDLARISELSSSSISKIESQPVNTVRNRNFTMLAAALKVDVHVINTLYNQIEFKSPNDPEAEAKVLKALKKHGVNITDSVSGPEMKELRHLVDEYQLSATAIARNASLSVAETISILESDERPTRRQYEAIFRGVQLSVERYASAGLNPKSIKSDARTFLAAVAQAISAIKAGAIKSQVRIEYSIAGRRKPSPEELDESMARLEETIDMCRHLGDVVTQRMLSEPELKGKA